MNNAVRKHQTRFGVLEERGPETILADAATAFMLPLLRVRRGDRAAEPGCGTGVLSICMALTGAARVTGTDTDPAAIAAARQNAASNRAPNAEFIEGSLLEPVAGPLDLVVANLPHRPAPQPFNARYYGGSDGTDLVRALISQAADKLAPGGRLVFYLNSIANPRRVLAALAERFDVTTLGERRRDFTREEFDALTPGLFAHLEAQRDRGEAEFWRDENELYFTGRVYEARLR
ncbi:MAG: methyltransferase [Verrucomicrobia bacterium]|nr:methyltransferase [Verrucomicrobiota bacterium]